jgi:hypothetical protein
MPRITLAAFRVAVVVAMSVAELGTAVAGQRCARRPDYVLVTADARLDERGQWHRRSGDGETMMMKSGHISRRAVERVERVASAATNEQAVRCLDALIANETSAAAAKACKVTR